MTFWIVAGIVVAVATALLVISTDPSVADDEED